MAKTLGKRDRNIFEPGDKEPFKLSRSKLELFLECPKCFYQDRRLGIGRPEGFPFTLNNAVDHLLKKEFDIYRANGEPHPLMRKYKIDAVPFTHDDLDRWRANFTGVQYLHPKTNFIITGAVDDVWINVKKELIVVDYKATSTTKEITLDEEYRSGYKRQIEIYQWLLRRNDFKVSDTGYFVYVNGKTDAVAFDGRLEFDVQIISYTGNDGWVEGTVIEAHKCLMNAKIPPAKPDCRYCAYTSEVKKVG